MTATQPPERQSVGNGRRSVPKVKIGLIGVGPGSIAQRVHIPSLRRIPLAEIVAVTSRSGTDIGQPVKMYADWAKMLDNEQLDLLYVMTPTVTHSPVVVAALERGIHVVCEKPPALTVAETQAMVDAAQARGLNLLFCFNRRFAPTYARLKRIAETRGCHTLILEKTRGQTEAISPWMMEAANQQWTEQVAREGGPIFEFVPHLFDLALWINGPVSAHTFSVRRLYGSAVNLSALGYLEHENGARSVVVYEEISGRGAERVTLYGPAITAEATGGMFAPNQLRVDDRGQTEVFSSPEERLEYSGFLQMSQHVVQCMAEGRAVDFDPADAIETVRLALDFDPAQTGNAEEKDSAR
jgi:predicted dehydrogenase